MMRCPGRKKDGQPCDYTSEDKFLFCPKCCFGSTTEEPEVTVIKCPGQLKPCGATLSSDHKFCSKCGWKIDRNLFISQFPKCPGKTEDGMPCGKDVKEGEEFCTNCGYQFSPEESRHESDRTTDCPPIGDTGETLSALQENNAEISLKHQVSSPTSSDMSSDKAKVDSSGKAERDGSSSGQTHTDGQSGPGDDKDTTNQPSGQGDDKVITNQPSGPGDDKVITNQPTEPGDDKDTTNQPSGPGDEKVTTNQPSGPGDDKNTTNQPTGPGDKKVIMNQPSGPGDDKVTTNQPSGPSDDKDTTNQPSGPGENKVITNQPSGPGDDKNTTNQPSGPSDDKDTTNQPSGPGDDKVTTNQPSGPSDDKDTTNQPSGPGENKDTTNQPSGPSDDKDTTNQPSGPGENKVITNQPSGPGDDKNTTNPPTGPGDNKVIMNQPSGPVDENVTTNQPFGPGDDKNTTNQPYGPGDDKVTTNQPYGPGDDTVTTNQPSGPGDDKVTTNQPSGPGDDMVTSNQPSGLSDDKGITNQPSGPSDDKDTTNQPIGPGDDKDTTNQPTGPSDDKVTTNQQSGPSDDKDTTNQPIGPSDDKVTTNQPSGPGDDKVTTNQPIGPSDDKVTTNQPSGPGDDKVTTNQPSEPGDDKVTTNQPSGPGDDKVTTNQPSGPGDDKDATNQPTGPGDNKVIMNQPSGPVDENVTTNQPFGPGDDKNTTNQPTGPSDDKVTTNQQSGPSDDKDTTNQPIGPSDDKVTTNQPSGPGDDKVTTNQPIGPSDDKVTTNQPSGPGDDKVTTNQPSEPGDDKVTTNQPSGPGDDKVTTNQPSGPGDDKVTINQPYGPGDDTVTTNQSSGPGDDKVTTNQPSGPGDDMVTSNQPSGLSDDKVITNQPSEPSDDKDTTNQPIGPGDDKDTTNQPTGPSNDKVTTNQPSGPGDDKVTTNQPSEPGDDKVTTNQPSGPGDDKVTTNQPSGPGDDNYATNQPTGPGDNKVIMNQPSGPVDENVTTNQPFGPGDDKNTTNQPYGPGDDTVTTNQSSGPGDDKVTTNQPSGPGDDMVTSNQPSGLSDDKVITNQPSGPSDDKDTINQPIGPGDDKDTTNQPTGPSDDKVTTNQPSGQGDDKVTTNQPSGPGDDKVTTNQPSGPSDDKDTTNQPIGPSDDKVTTNQPSEPGDDKVTTNQPSGPDDDKVITNQPSEPGDDKDTTNQPIGPSDDKVTTNEPSGPDDDKVTTNQPSEPGDDKVTTNQPSGPGDDKDATNQPSGTDADKVTTNQPSEPETEEKIDPKDQTSQQDPKEEEKGEEDSGDSEFSSDEDMPDGQDDINADGSCVDRNSGDPSNETMKATRNVSSTNCQRVSPDAKVSKGSVVTQKETKDGTDQMNDLSQARNDEQSEGENTKKKKRNRRRNRGHKQGKQPQNELVSGNSNSWDNSEKVEVVFHVVISEEFKLKPDTDQVFISFRDESLGGWNRFEKWKMKLVRQENELILYSCCVQMPKSFRNKGFLYRYVVRTQDQAVTRETVYTQQIFNSKDADRHFYLQTENKHSSETWNQYDGFVYPKLTESRLQRALKIFHDVIQHKISHDVKVATGLFLPSYEEVERTLKNDGPGDSETAWHLVKKISDVVAQMSQHVGVKNTRLTSSNFKEEIISDYVVPLLIKLEKRGQHADQEKLESKSGLLLGMFVLTLFKKNNMKLSTLEIDRRHLRGLLFQPNRQKMECSALVVLEKHFPGEIKFIIETVVDLINPLSQSYKAENGEYLGNSSWLYLVPLLHFLRRDSRPFEKLMTPDHNTNQWWGHKDLMNEVNKLKHYSFWSIPVQDVIEDLEYLFDVDYLLPRTIMACVSFDSMRRAMMLQKVPAEVCSGTLFYYCDKFKNKGLSEKSTLYLASCMDEVANKFKQEREQRIASGHAQRSSLEECFKKRHIGLKISSDVLRVCQVYQNQYVEIIHAATELFASSIYECSDHEEELMNNHEKEFQEKERKSLRAFVEECWSSVSSWMERRFRTGGNLENYIVFLDEMMKFDFGISNLTDEWKDVLLNAVESVLSKMTPKDCFQVYDKVDIYVLHTGLQEKMTKAAFLSFKTMIKNFGKMPGINGDKIGKYAVLMSNLLQLYWPGESDDLGLMKHILTWKSLPQYFLHFSDRSIKSLFSQECTEHLKKSKALLEKLRDFLLKGDIHLGLLKLILEQKALFLDNLLSSGCCDKTEIKTMECVLEARNKELQVYKKSLRNSSILLNMAAHIRNVDSNQLAKRIHEEEESFEDVILTTVCRNPMPKDNAVKEKIEGYRPKITIEGIGDKTLAIVPQLEKYKESFVFVEMWRKEGNSVLPATPFELAVQHVWKRTSSAWRNLCQGIRDGTETFSNVHKHVGKLGIDFEKIEKEFKLMCEGSSSDWVAERIDQLKRYEMLQGCQKAARIIIEIKAIYKLTGNFEPIEAVQHLVHNENQPMRNLDSSVVNTCIILKGMDDADKHKCLVAFKNASLLVEWLRNSMKDMKEVKVYVDLAYISAGEEQVEIEKVNCFHAAVTGYAPLIFDSPQDCNYETFLKNCKLTWKEMESDKHLDAKLLDASRHLHWLKEVKESHGSVEVTSLTQADMINTRGCYRIGNLNGLENVADLSLNNVISLQVSPDTDYSEDQGESLLDVNKPRKYTYGQLVDLQSRLMLVAGKAERGKENVDRFVMVLDGIVRLAQTYIRLCCDGCVLFSCWNGEFLCGEIKACAILEFGLDQDYGTLKGHRGKESVDDFVLALANQFEKFHEEWLEYVSDKRDKFLELNFYTIDQLVFLQRELIKLGTEEEPSDRVYPMLSLIKPNCTQADLTNAMQIAEEIVLGRQEGKRSLEVIEPSEDDDPALTFINAMIEANFSESLANQALETVKNPKNIDDGLVWCFEHQEDEVEETNPMDTEPTFSGWQVGRDSVAINAAAWVKAISDENRYDTTVKTLKANLKSVWTKFLEAVSSSVADYLSLEHLGIILGQLAEADQQTFDRTIPLPLQCGIPNLLICPQVDMLNAVLYIYKNSDDEPLPQPDEVLLCTPHTRFDQVDIFLRRAFFSNPGKAYTLANADHLQYEIQEKTEKKLKEYAREEKQRYQLVILCSTENEFKARIVAALERNRCPLPPLQNLEEIRQYLRTKFSQEYDTEELYSASHLDFDSSTVRVVKSTRAGVGKTLYKKRQVEALQRLNPGIPSTSVTIHLYKKTVSSADVAEKLLGYELPEDETVPRIIHLDISYEVQEGVDYLLFNLLVLGCISNNMGHVWLRSPLDLYLVETIPITDARHERRVGQRLIHPLLEVLPDVYCWSPQDSLQILTSENMPQNYTTNDSLFDETEFQSPVYQRPFQYLNRWSNNNNLTGINPAVPEGTPEECINVLLQHCGVRDPAWSELHNFVWFLNTQLMDFEKSVFCSDVILEDLPGFPVLVMKFLIQMSRDFATRSLVMSEESPLDWLNIQKTEDEDLAQFQMKRTWESSPHPYIFFNPDGHTMTFLGFNIERRTGNMVDQQTGQVLEEGLVSRPLQVGLQRNRVNINENFDQMQRLERLEKLCNVMPGVDYVHDPDETYELTTDNVKKILAIYMRFRCGIPVIIMGETGCGKTRLVKFMCDLQCPPGSDIENMVIMKVHGGTTSEDIIRKVQHAEELAAANKAKNQHMYTVLFFDEANTTESIGLIKEIMCDGAMDGLPLRLSENLKIVAACNPYRKHSNQLIERLEKAGLGYHVEADKTTDKLGRVPMRRLVYRVQPLPQSMLPLVWDFGQLNTQVEELYIKQMVNRYIRNDDLPLMYGLVERLSKILIESQRFMRDLEDECSFVSLRDVDRTLRVMAWFYQQSQEYGTLFDRIDEHLNQELESEEEESEEEGLFEYTNEVDDLPNNITKALILALSVCYRASLRSRDEFDSHIIDFFGGPCTVPGGKEQMVQVIDSCQSVFVDEVNLEDNIAKNLALKENLFMMVVCIELRIPLFLVGKPGSSKSLAKTIVADAMQGNSARSCLFKQLKEARMVSFQCSPLATAEGIVGTFRQCARYQQEMDLDRFVSIVVLDEVGLAEDSPRMPLKTLHPLLEDGWQGDEESEPCMKVAFIGISNWALDPAKMNRGILVQREAPDKEELVKSAEGICSSNGLVFSKIKTLLPELAAAYEEIFTQSQESRREFFGLRDFYSLVKMVNGYVAAYDRDICWHQLVHAIKRNFGGLDNLDAVEIFRKHIRLCKEEEEHDDDPDSTIIGLIEAGLFGGGTNKRPHYCPNDLDSMREKIMKFNFKSGSRYLLVLTENYGALGILQQQILLKNSCITIFGSSFPKDQEYTQICRNINRIKVCMETGSTVILLNLENLYESLYDALNQYYARLGSERFVDLGLGTHRVKCRVHQDFRLIVVAEKQIVLDKFPIPLINRLEKHFLTLDNLMTSEQTDMADQLEHWAKEFVTPRSPSNTPKRKEIPEDAFIGYHADTAAAIVLHVWGRKDQPKAAKKDLLNECKEMLLWCASPQYVVRLPDQKLGVEAEQIQAIYLKHQKHNDIIQYLNWKLIEEQQHKLQAQITTHSKLLTDQEKEDLARNLNLTPNNIILLTLQSFDTEQQFAQQIKNFVKRSKDGQKLLLIQCGSGDRNQNLIKSAQYCVLDELPDEDLFAVVFIIQLPNIAGGCFSGFQAGKWHSLHLDELRPQAKDDPTMELLSRNPPSVILKKMRTVQNTTQRGVEPTSATGMETSFRSIEEGPEVIYQRTAPVGGEETEDMAVAPFIRQLLLPCIQSAAALIKDDESNSRRSTKRIEMLLRLIGNKVDEDAKVFIQSLSQLIINLLEEKELTGGSLPKNWLFKEAAQTENVQQAGTFRRAWIQLLEKKVTPVLAEVIAFIDTDRNMDFICEPDKAPWTRRLWLGLLKHTHLCFDHCKSYITGQKQYHHGAIIPQHSGVSGSVVNVQTPFFWLLYQDIDNAITQARETEEGKAKDPEACLKYLERIIRSIPFGEVLVSVVGEEDLEDVITAYLGDFVQTVYPGMTESWKILCDSLMSAARQNGRDLFSLSLIQALIYIHIIHSEAKERLHLFLEVEQVWPEVVQTVTGLKSSVAGNPLLTADEMTLDVLSLMILLEMLVPNKEQINTDDGRATWMDRVKTYLPVIERILKTTESDLEHGPVCCAHIDQARCGWVRVVTMKLFFESFMSSEKHKIEARSMTLWMLLGDSADLTKIESLKKVEQFLKLVNGAVEKKLSRKRGKCSHCETDFGEALGTQLPCRHRICLRCLGDLQVQTSGNKKCPVCHTKIPGGFKTDTSSPQQREVLEEYRTYQKYCNNFLMSVVSKLCFGGIRTPDSAVIERIFTYITRRVDIGNQAKRLCTKQMSVFEDMIDPTPVVRSFLLQLLIHKSEKAVTTYLEEFFHHARNLCQQGREETSKETLEEIVQFSLLVIHCYEDLYHEHGSVSADPFEEMKAASQCLAEGRKLIAELGIDMPKMLAIAQCRFGLAVAAKYMHEVLIQKSMEQSREFNNLLYEVKNLLSIEKTEWPKKFLVKQICKDLGSDSYQAICSTDTAAWLAVETTQEVKESPDRYVICRTSYNQLREAVAKILLGENTKHLKKILKKDEMLFMLAVHREVTMKNVMPQREADSNLQRKSQQSLKEFINSSQEKIVQKELALKLLRNEFGREGSYLNIKPYQSLRDQSLVCLLFHTYLVLTHYNNKQGFLKPLSDLINHPAYMKDKFFPTMPQDDTDSIRQILLAALKENRETADHSVVFFFCPDGHPYVITECGRPVSEGRCNICGQRIGGLQYQSFAGNVSHSGTDQTRRGHILGTASERTNIFAGERHLGGAACAVLRFFTHAALMLGAEANPQAVEGLVYPALQQDVGKFFWDHLQKDLEIIHLATGKSVDDVFLLLHFICHQITELDKFKRCDPQVLNSKQARQKWENDFATTFINAPLKDMENCLRTCNDMILNDQRIGQDVLMSILYEVDKSAPTEVECLHEFPVVWRYRSRITLENFLREFDLHVENSKNKKSKMAILSLFRQEHPYLQALHHIPNILHLQQFLMAKYRRCLDREQANKMTIGDMLSIEDKKSRDYMKRLLPDFIAAWESVKESLHSAGCLTVENGIIRLPDAYKNMVIDENSPLAVLLPSTQGPGICSYMLLEFLFRKHNEFMEKYCQKTKTKYDRLPEVSVRKLHSNHLINYHPERDLLPIVLANCNYSFELGKGTTIEYDFEGFEYQLQEAIFQSKSRVEQKSHIIPINTMIYKADAGSAVMFTSLRDKIPQESLAPAVKLQIIRELKTQLPDICDSINNLNITISFLKSLGGREDQSLHKFMSDALKMKQTVTSQKAQQFCQFKHVQSLWLLLNFEKSVVIADKFREDPFSNLDSDQREELDEEMRGELEQFFQNKSLDKLEYLLQQMFDCLLLRVAQPADPFDEDALDMMTRSLGHILIGHLEAPLYNSEKDVPEYDDQILSVDELDSFPANILGKHIPDSWLMVLKEVKQRKKETVV